MDYLFVNAAPGGYFSGASIDVMDVSMTDTILTRRNRRVQNDIAVTLGLSVVVLFFVASGLLSYWNTRILSHDAALVTHTHEVLTGLDDVVSYMKDAETGQRGYVLTGNEKYLAPYNSALTHIEEQLNTIQQLTMDNPEHQSTLPLIREHIKAKLDELGETIDLRRTKGFDAALAVVLTDRGKNEMDTVRNLIDGMEQKEQILRAKRFSEMDEAYKTALVSGVLTGFLGVVLSGLVGYMIRRTNMVRRRQEWLQSGQVGLGSSVFGEQMVGQLGQNVLTFLSEYVDAHAGAFFIRAGESFRRIATYGVSGDNTPQHFTLSEGLLGQAVRDDRTFLVKDVPEGYLTIGSALGRDRPRHLIISPASVDGEVQAVFELGFIHPLPELTVELLEKLSDSIAIAVRSANYREHLQNLLEETQRQGEELQSQSEELRVNNEELEEQSRSLKESQARLEQQQAEMEQTNAQLEEQTQMLERQRDDLTETKTAVQLKAQELEKASQYKSDFLANMSHELRTPLNSSLILAKLLGDNMQGNLTEEQVKFAQTIESSGNDLLMLINDILDLSKIEAGHMEVRPEPVSLARLVKDIARTFDPLAKQKGLTLKTSVEEGCADIETDRQRLEQILKNLLSNAIKFTESGTVELSIGRGTGQQVEFRVSDTGIGIAQEQQNAIFEAFRQADGTISRRYGGTGLGLSISRELTRLLGGMISLSSEAGKGSRFTISLPETYDPQLVMARMLAPAPEATLFEAVRAPRAKVGSPPPRARSMEDDRDRLTGNSRTILIVEDDDSFARILFELAHELNFECLIATTAEEALIVASQYLPSAVILDVGLPDSSGLSVLDRLKHDARTRHIPVHVVSANDYAQTAMALGAVGYMIKPVQREQLVKTLKQLETKLTQRLRRVLVVEDDHVQRDSVRKLLGSQDVETVGVGTAAECLERLKDSTFDCMVLDLSLPDATGYSLLETLSKEDAYSFPPVIVYTGRDLSADEEQRLRRYSKSIIIKGAKSPERLLDEVTLFLHQVVADLPPEQQRMLEKSMNRDALLEGKHILVVEDDVRNVYALSNIFEPRGAIVHIARNGLEALAVLDKTKVDLVLMDVMMPEMDGLTATREIRKRPELKKLPVIMLTAKAMKDDQERCLDSGANDYMAKPLDVEKLLSLVRVWMAR
jgi:signal transduction histidine kinase/DNA-binding response OmpR family regulator/CHASE3 domain sensor protein